MTGPIDLFGQATTVVGVLALSFYVVLLVHCLGTRLLLRRSCAASKTSLEQPTDIIQPSAFHHALLKSGSWIELAQARRLEYSRLLLRTMIHVGAVMLAYLIVARFFCGWQRKECTGKPSSDAVSLVAPLLVLSIFFVLKPKQFTYRRRDMLHCLAIARIAWQVAELDNAYMVVFQRQTMLALRIALGTIMGNLPLTSVLNVLYSGLAILMYLSLLPDDAALPISLFTAGHKIWFIFDEVFSTLVLVAVCYAIESRTSAEAQATAEMRVSKLAAVTLQSILDSFCDAIVHVSQDLTIVDGSGSINTLLLCAGGRQVEGSNLLEVIDKRDQSRFCAHLAAYSKEDCCRQLYEKGGTKDAEAAVNWIVVRIVDACGVRVNVQIFHSCLTGIYEESLGFLLGIRELSREDEDLPQVLGNPSAPMAPVPHGKPSKRSVDYKDMASVGLLDVVEDPDTVACWFRADDLSILRGTAAFAVLAGPGAAGTSFAHWMVDKAGIVSQLQEKINDAIYEERFQHALQIDDLKLRLPRRKQVLHTARCTFIIENAAKGVDIANICVKAVLEEMTTTRLSSGHELRCNSSLRSNTKTKL
mmetsp:Transcript_32495/g.74252  ORF Transcript_32495/g.74252 Transcript_32495/m.74252 type:complete len:587 (+) Transcript_32495:63-1823(+)